MLNTMSTNTKKKSRATLSSDAERPAAQTTADGDGLVEEWQQNVAQLWRACLSLGAVGAHGLVSPTSSDNSAGQFGLLFADWHAASINLAVQVAVPVGLLAAGVVRRVVQCGAVALNDHVCVKGVELGEGGDGAHRSVPLAASGLVCGLLLLALGLWGLVRLPVSLRAFLRPIGRSCRNLIGRDFRGALRPDQVGPNAMPVSRAKLPALDAGQLMDHAAVFGGHAP
jgi:hypothetical protein